MSSTPTTPREGATDTADASACGYCGRRFPREDLLALHRGLDHPDTITDQERAAFEAAHDEETDALRLFRLRVLLVLVVIYFGFVMVYALV